MAISCDVSNKIIAGAITSESILQKIVIDMRLIESYDNAIAKLGDDTKGIATLAYAKKGVESKILYQTVGSYITKVLQDESVLKVDKVRELQKTLKQLMPNNKEYIDKLDQLPILKSYLRGSIDEKKFAGVIAFDIANLHKLENVKKGGVEHIYYGKMGVGGAYNIYRDLMLDIVNNKAISESDMVLKLQKYTSEHGEIAKEYSLAKPEEIIDIIKNAKSMKQLEEIFIFYANYMDSKTFPVFLSKIDDFKYTGDMETKAFWQSLGESYFNPDKYVIGYKLDEMNKRALAYGKFEGTIFNDGEDYYKFIDNAADVITGKKNQFTWKGVEFNQKNKNILVHIVGMNNLEVAYARRGETSIQYDYIKQLQSADKNIDIKPDIIYDLGITNVKGYEQQKIDELVDKAKQLEQEGKYKEAQNLFNQSITPGIDSIKQNFGEKVKFIDGGIGRYDNKSEPTIILQMKNITDDDVDELVELSDKGFKQKSFFLAEKIKNKQKFGIINAEQGLSIEPGIIVYTKHKITLENVQEIDKIFNEVGLYGGTILPNGKGIKIYNLSAFNKNYEQFEEQIIGVIDRFKHNDTIGIKGTPKQETFRVRHIGIDGGEGLGTYEGWRNYRGSSFLSRKKVVGGIKEYKYNDPLTVKARSFDKFSDFGKKNKGIDIKELKKARKQKDEISEPKVQTKEEVFENGPNTDILNYQHSMLKVIAYDNTVPPIEEHIFYEPNILRSDELNEGYNAEWKLQSFQLGQPKEIIVDENTLIGRINNSGEKEVYIMTRDITTKNKLLKIGHEKGIKIRVTCPSGSASIRIGDNKLAYIGFVDNNQYNDFIDAFQGQIFKQSELYKPVDVLGNISIGDKKITQEVIETYGLFSPTNEVTFIQTASILRNTSRLDGRFTNMIVDYSDEYAQVQAMDISDIVDDIEELTNTKITLQIDPTNIPKIKNDYYNYAFASNLPNKTYAFNKLVENFQIEGGDVLYNYAKKDYIFKRLLITDGLSVRLQGFDDLMELLVKDNISEDMIRDNLFIKNTILSNKNNGNPIVSDSVILYDYIKNTLLKEADSKIYNKNNITSEFVQSSIDVPRSGEGFAIVANDVIMPPTHSRIWDIIGGASKYENGEIVVDESILKQMQEGKPIEDLGNSDGLLDMAKYSKEGVDELFTLYLTKVDEIIKAGGDKQWENLQKLYDNFEYRLIQLEDKMQSTLGKTLDYDKFDGYHHAIGSFSRDLSYDKYIEVVTEQKNNILDLLETSKNNINNGVANGGILNNGNVLKGNIVEDGANYAYHLGKESGDNAPYDVLKKMDNEDIKNYIVVQKNKIASDIAGQGLIYTMYKSISPTLRNYGFLDEYKLVDTLYGYKLPKALVDVNPSLYSNGKVLNVDMNDELILNIYHGIIDMYNNGYTKGGLKITGDIDQNLANIQQIVANEFDNIVNKYGKDAFDGVNPKGIRDAYTDVFLPYSSFLVMPQVTINAVAKLKNMNSGKIGDFLSLYLSKEPPESVLKGMEYDENVLKEMTENTNNLEILADDGLEKTYQDVFVGGVSDFIMRKGSSILEKQGTNGRILLNLQIVTKVSGRQMANFLYEIVNSKMLPKRRLIGKQLKGKDKIISTKVDMNLLRDSQDTLVAIAHKNNRELDEWHKLHISTSDNIAFSVAKYLNAYKTLLNGKLDDAVLSQLHNVFYMIGRDNNGNIIDDITQIDNIAQQIHRLSTIGESNSFLGIFNMSTAPKTPLSDISFNMFSDGKVFVEDVNKAMDQFEAFNKMFKLNLTQQEYESLFQNMFGGKLVEWSKWIQNTGSWINRYLGFIGPAIKRSYVIGANVLSAFTTGFIPGLARGKSLTKGISKADTKLLTDIMCRYNLLGEFADLSDVGMQQLVKEAEVLGGGNIAKGMLISMSNGSAYNTLDLITKNTNNIMDVTLMGNYKIFALYSAMQSLDGKRFFSVQDFEDYLQTLSDDELQKLLYMVEADANKGFYSVIAAADSFMDKAVPSTGLEIFGVNTPANIRRYGSSLIRGLSSSLSFMNGWGDGIIRHFATGILNNIDIAKYFWENGVNTDTINSVVRAIEKRPEYLQWLSTLQADIMLLARGYRYQKTGEDDGHTTLEDIMDALGTWTTIGAGRGSSLIGQLLSRGIATNKQINKQKELNPEDEFNKGKTFAWTIASTISSRLMSKLKYLKPRKYMITKAESEINKGMDVGDAYAKAFWNMLLDSGSGMLKFMMADNYDPDNLSFSLQDRGDLPRIIGARLTPDQEAAYAQQYIQKADLGNFANFFPTMWKATLFNTVLSKTLKDIFKGKKPTENDIVNLSYQDKFLYDTLYQGSTPEVGYGDVNSIKNYIFDDSLLDVAYMRAYLESNTGVIKNGKGYLDDAITTVYNAIGKDKVKEIYQMIQGTKTKNKDDVKHVAYTLLKKAVEKGDMGELDQLAKSMLFQANLSLEVHDHVPSGKGVTELDKEDYYLKEFKDKYQFIKSNNSNIAVNFILAMSDRMNTEGNKFFDEEGNIDKRYYQYLQNEVDTWNDIRNGDVDSLVARYNPLVISQKYIGRKLRNDDGTINEEVLTSMSKALNYISATETERGEGETTAMLVAIARPLQEEVIDAALKGLIKGEGLSRATQEMIDKYFYTEGKLSDYIINLHTGIDSLQGGGGDVGKKLKRAKAEFKSLSDALDKVRGKFESHVKLSPFEIDYHPLNSVDKNVFVAKPKGSYYSPSGQETTLNLTEKQKDINRKIKESKEFKFK